MNFFINSKKENNDQTIIWVLEDALSFPDIIVGLTEEIIDPHSHVLQKILRKRLIQKPLNDFFEIKRLRDPITGKRANYLPQLISTPRINYIMQHPDVGVTFESLNLKLYINNVHSMHLGAAAKWKAFDALIKEENDKLFFSKMLVSLNHYIHAYIRKRDKIFAHQLLTLSNQYPHAIIFTDRGIDHMDSLESLFKHPDFKDKKIRIYSPIAYKKTNYSLLQFEPFLLKKNDNTLSDTDKDKLMLSFKRFFLHELLSQSIHLNFLKSSSIAADNVAQNIIEEMSKKEIKQILKIVQNQSQILSKENKPMLVKHILNWFIKEKLISSKTYINNTLAKEAEGFSERVEKWQICESCDTMAHEKSILHKEKTILF